MRRGPALAPEGPRLPRTGHETRRGDRPSDPRAGWSPNRHHPRTPARPAGSPRAFHAHTGRCIYAGAQKAVARTRKCGYLMYTYTRLDVSALRRPFDVPMTLSCCTVAGVDDHVMTTPSTMACVKRRVARAATVLTVESTHGAHVASLRSSPSHLGVYALGDLGFSTPSGAGGSSQPQRPSRLLLSHSADVLALPTDFVTEPAARAAHVLHTFPA